MVRLLKIRLPNIYCIVCSRSVKGLFQLRYSCITKAQTLELAVNLMPRVKDEVNECILEGSLKGLHRPSLVVTKGALVCTYCRVVITGKDKKDLIGDALEAFYSVTVKFIQPVWYNNSSRTNSVFFL